MTKTLVRSRLSVARQSAHRHWKALVTLVALLAVGVVGKSAVSGPDSTAVAAPPPANVSAWLEADPLAPRGAVAAPAGGVAAAVNRRHAPFPPGGPGSMGMPDVPPAPSAGAQIKATLPKPGIVPDHQIAAARLIAGPQETWQAPAPMEHPFAGQQPPSPQKPGDVNGDRPPREPPQK